MEVDPRRVIFIGWGTSAVCYYRCLLPALAMGADWVGVVGEPPKLQFATGMVRSNEDGKYDTMTPDILGDRYDIIVLQQPKGGRWVKLIDALRERGKIVVYEIDDYLHGIQSEPDHHGKEHFTKTLLSDVEWAMRHCDALIASTPFIAEMYRHYCKDVFVCRNGVDLKRYNLGRPKRKTTNLGWAGATGHLPALIPWLQQVANIMRMREKTCFVSIGRADFATGFQKAGFPEERVIGIPWAAIEQYPGAMTMLDIALAPAKETLWWRGKSDLRWLEAAALGIPVIANPVNYPEIKHGETGFHAHSPQESAEIMLRLIDDKTERRIVGHKAREYVNEHRGINSMVAQWLSVFETLYAGAPTEDETLVVH